MKNNHFFGIYAEKLAMCFLIVKGYKILAWRYKTPFGEIDIIAKKNNFLVFIEVKSSLKKILNIEIALRKDQINRMFRATNYFIKTNKQLQKIPQRFDFIEVKGYFSLKHHCNFMS
jgi:putative endonuclease